MYSEEERAKWRELVARWKAGEKVFDAGKRVEKTDATTVQRQEPVQPIKRQYGKVIDQKLAERKQQQQPVIKQGNTYKVKPRPQTFAGRVTQAIGGDWIKADMASAGVSQIPVVGQLNGALDFGYDLNNSTHNILDVESNTNTAMSGIALLPFVRNGLKMLKGKTLSVKLRNLYDKVMTSSNSADDVNKALKTGRTADAVQDAHGLDWSTWSKGGPISKEHLQEYADIERNARQSGTWLQMPDGSLWDGDPHSWVQLMSKDGQKILPKRYFHGSDDFYVKDGMDVTPKVKGTKSIWMSSNPYVARTYTTGDHKVYELGIPKNAKVHSIDANGRNWRTVLQDENGNWLTTNDVASNPQYQDGIVQIKNVWDPGSSLVTKKSKYYITPTQEEKNMTWSEFSRIHQIGDDIITNGVPRKSLLYNNGDFNLSDPNIYKMLTPGILAGTGYGIYNKYAE